MPKKTLNMIQVTPQTRRAIKLLGRRSEDKTKGTAGNKNLASWWGKMERTATPDRAEPSLNESCGR